MSSIKSSAIDEQFRPVIGILSYDIDFDIRDAYQLGTKYPFFISAAFSKWLECAGAQVIPIWADRKDEYYRDIMGKINGVLFPGGKFWFNDVNGKAAYSAHKIYNIAKEINDSGKYFPIWGTTLGFQLLFYAASGGETNSREQMSAFHGNFPLNFENDFANSKLFGEVQPYILELLTTKEIASYYSIYCVTKEILDRFNIRNDWHILSTATNNEKEFITSAEHKNYPFFGVMFAPQRTQFENVYLNNHSNDAIIVSQYFASFFVKQAQRNVNTMLIADRLRYSIYNFDVKFVEPRVPQFRQVYLFEQDTDYPQNEL